MIKRFLALLLGGILLFSLTSIGFADSGILYEDCGRTKINLKDDDTLYPEKTTENADASHIRGPVSEYFWKITKKEFVRYEFDDWRVGPTGTGDCLLNINESTTLNRNFTSTLSGSAPVGTNSIAASLGVSIGFSKQHGTGYTLKIPANERRTILFRPKIGVYKITQTEYKMNSYTGELTAIDTAVATVNVFDGWDYSWRYGY